MSGSEGQGGETDSGVPEAKSLTNGTRLLVSVPASLHSPPHAMRRWTQGKLTRPEAPASSGSCYLLTAGAPLPGPYHILPTSTLQAFRICLMESPAQVLEDFPNKQTSYP